MEQDSAIYITFTWLLRAIVLASCDMDVDKNDGEYDCVESKANGIVADTFGELTLNEIYAIILLESQTLPWMRFTDADNVRILEKLNENRGEIAVGDMKYSDFFMKKGARSTISDWINRVNARTWRSVCAVF